MTRTDNKIRIRKAIGKGKMLDHAIPETGKSTGNRKKMNIQVDAFGKGFQQPRSLVFMSQLPIPKAPDTIRHLSLLTAQGERLILKRVISAAIRTLGLAGFLNFKKHTGMRIPQAHAFRRAMQRQIGMYHFVRITCIGL